MNARPEVVKVSARTYVALEDALGTRVRYFALENETTGEALSGIRLEHPHGGKSWDIVPAGISHGLVDAVVAALREGCRCAIETQGEP